MNAETLNTKNKQGEEITTSWDFMNEDDWSDDIDYFPGDYDEEYGIEADFHDKVDEVINLNLGNALIRLEKVLEKFPIHHVSVTVDVNGMENTEAFCMNSGDFETTGRNSIGIGVGPRMLRSFLEKHFYPNSFNNPYYELNFDHELIHGMDQNLWKYSPKGLSAKTPKEHLLHYLLKYQTEGLACFSTFLRGHLAEKSFIKAASKFDKKWRLLTSFDEQNPENWKNVLNKMESHQNDPYHLGPMMVLQAIKVKASENNDDTTLNSLEKAMKIEYLNNDEINHLIIAGLELSFPEFVDGLYKPDLKGRSFMDKHVLFAAFERLNTWTDYLTEDEKNKASQEASITELEKELESINHLDDEMMVLKKLELDYQITNKKAYQDYQSRCNEFYENLFVISL
jgi:hypothetical protein